MEENKEKSRSEATGLTDFSLCLCVQVVRLVSASAMASTNVTLENQLHSAQKNLLFLQQDHANTLKGLHAEIRRLQQQCTGEHGHRWAHRVCWHREEQTNDNIALNH